MPDFAASGPRVELEPALAWLLLGPLLAVLSLLVGRIFSRAAGAPSRFETAACKASWLGFAASAVLAAYFAFDLGDSERLLIQALSPALRIGSLDVAVAFELDRLRAWLVAAVALLFAFLGARGASSRPLASSVSGLAWLLCAVSDNLVYAWLGLTAVELGGFAIARRAGVPFRVSDAAWIVGFALLFWGFGGSWSTESEFLPELRERLAVMERPGSGADDTPTVSLTSLPGARVRVGGALLCEVSARGRAGGTGTRAEPCRKVALAPFVDLPLRAGVHDLVVSPGGGSDQFSLASLKLERPVEIISTGPTLVPRELWRQLALEDGQGRRPHQRTFARSELLGMPVSTWLGLLFGLALGARLGKWLSVGLALGAARALRPSELSAPVLWSLLLARVGFVLEYAGLAFACGAGAAAAVVLLKDRTRLRGAEPFSALGRRLRAFDARLARWLLVLLVAFFSTRAGAASAEIDARPLEGDAPLELLPKNSAYEAELVLENRGTSEVSGLGVVVVQGSEFNPSSPRGLSVRFVDGSDSITLGPGESRRAVVRFSPPRDAHLREIHAQVLVVESTRKGEQTLAAVGVHAEADDGVLSRHGLSFVLLLPLAGLIGIAAAKALRYRRVSALRAAVVLLALAKLALVLALLAAFDPLASRLDGNGGYQFVERALISQRLGIEYFVGVDGFGIAALLALALINVVCALASLSVATDVPGYLAATLAFDFASSLSVLAVDSVLLVLAVILAAACKLILAGGIGAANRRALRPALRFAIGLGAILFALGLSFALEGAPAGYLVDGSPRSGPASLLELAQAGAGVASEPASAPIGLCLVVLGVLILIGAAPFHALNLAFVRAARAPAQIAVLAGFACALLHVLLRIGLGSMPGSMAAIAPGLAWVGAGMIAYASLASFGAADLVEVSVYAAAAHVGLFLLGLASKTAIAVQGAELVVFAGCLGLAGVLAVAAVLRERLPSVELSRLRGLASELLGLTVLSGCSMAALALIPLSVSFFALLGVVVGAAPFHPGATACASFGISALAVGLCRLWLRLFLGAFDEGYRKLPELEPHAGRLPSLRLREWFGLAVLAFATQLLGLWPRPLLDITDGAAVDYAEPVNPPGPLQVTQTRPIRSGG